MTGEYEVEISTRNIGYKFTIRRNITIIQGDSATGKTQLISLLDSYKKSGLDSGIVIKSKVNCVHINIEYWEMQVKELKNCIIFIDEGESCLIDDKFASAIKHTDNYYVIITRDSLCMLPYSIKEIYGMRKSKKYSTSEKVYNELHELYGGTGTRPLPKPDVIITEDSKSGFDFFSKVCKDNNIIIDTANGRDNIPDVIDSGRFKGKRVLIIADGAAFGCAMEKAMISLEKHLNYTLYLPESFEYLLLNSGIFRDKEVDEALQHPYDYADSTKFFSWERYFTYLITEACKRIPNTHIVYTKSRLNNYFLQDSIVDKVMNSIGILELNRDIDADDR